MSYSQVMVALSRTMNISVLTGSLTPSDRVNLKLYLSTAYNKENYQMIFVPAFMEKSSCK